MRLLAESLARTMLCTPWLLGAAALGQNAATKDELAVRIFLMTPDDESRQLSLAVRRIGTPAIRSMARALAAVDVADGRRLIRLMMESADHAVGGLRALTISAQSCHPELIADLKLLLIHVKVISGIRADQHLRVPKARPVRLEGRNLERVRQVDLIYGELAGVTSQSTTDSLMARWNDSKQAQTREVLAHLFMLRPDDRDKLVPLLVKHLSSAKSLAIEGDSLRWTARAIVRLASPPMATQSHAYLLRFGRAGDVAAAETALMGLNAPSIGRYVASTLDSLDAGQSRKKAALTIALCQPNRPSYGDALRRVAMSENLELRLIAKRVLSKWSMQK